MLEVRLLGGLAATADGRPVALPPDARARELLARLALAPGPQSRSALAGRLRPDVPEESARKTLRSALYELRRALGPAAIAASGEQIGLAAGVRVDVREFRRLLTDGDLEGAWAAGSGELLAGSGGEWADRARAEHDAELARLLGELAARAEAAGDLPAAVAWARRRAAAEPLAEAAGRELVRLLAAAGDGPAALAEARALSARLRDGLGMAPSPAVRALVEDVRRGRIGPAPAAAPAPALPAPLARAARPEGRAAELARLERAWADAGAGALQAALVRGEPGIGKTTLAAELARRAHAAGGAVLLGRSDEHALVPFQPWIEALDGLLAGLPPAEAAGWLQAHDGALARLLPAHGPAPGDPEGPRERYLAFEVARRLLQGLAARRPVLLVLDDVHWADADSLALLRHVVRASPAARMLLVLSARPAELGPDAAATVAGLRRAAPLVTVDLAGLDEDAVAAVLARHPGAGDRAAARRLRERTGGNPLFLDELLREAGGPGGGAGGPPAGVREVITRRLARLPEPTVHALEAAAVLGTWFDLPTLADVQDLPVAGLLEALDPAADAALVAPPDALGRSAFPHALVAEAIACGLPASRRARLHGRAADVLAARHAAGRAGAGEVVRHLRAAAPLPGPERLAAWELAAAREAAGVLAHDDAAAHYEAALAVLSPADPGRAEVLAALGDALDRAGRRGRARAAFREAAALAEPAGDAPLLARAALGHGGTGLVIAAADPATVGLLERALAAVPRGEPATAPRLLARLSAELYYTDPQRAAALSADAVERAEAAGEPAALAAALNARRVALWRPEHAAERLEVATAMLAAAEAAGDREAVLQARNWRVVDLMELGRMADAAREVDAFAALADVVALPHFGWYVPLWRGTFAVMAGRWDEAVALGDRALALGARADDPNAPMFVGIQRGFARSTRDRAWERERERLTAGAAASPAGAGWGVYLVLLDAQSGAGGRARRRLAELTRDGCRALPMDANWHAACILAEAAVLLGDRDAGAALHGLLAPHAGLFPVVARGVASLGSAERYAGRLAGLLGRHDEAVARLRRAVDADDRAGAATQAAEAQLVLGRALAAAGDPAAARGALDRAAARAAALDLPALAAEARGPAAAG